MSRTPADATTTTDAATATTATAATADTAAADPAASTTTAGPSAAGSLPALSRRSVVVGAGAVAGIGVLTACGGGSTTAPAAPATAPEAPAGGASAPAAAPATGPLAAVADIPVGGGTVFADRDVVVTQPTAGDFKAFSATCTHRGCKVNAVADGQIKCPCHASNFAIADGSVTSGPAQAPLPAKTITVDGGSIVLA
jgi:Rieske Fe-S protein